MAAVSEVTLIIGASDTSGALHQAAEYVRLGRWLFIASSVGQALTARAVAGQLGKLHDRLRGETSFACAG